MGPTCEKKYCRCRKQWMGAFDAFDGALGVSSDAPAAKVLMYVSYIAIVVVLVTQTLMSVLFYGMQIGASLVKKANHYIYVFQTPEYELGNVPSVSLKASGSAERYLLFFIIAIFVGVLWASAYFFLSMRSGASLQLQALVGFLLAYSAINVLVLVPGFYSSSGVAKRHLLMRTLFNNAVFNSISADTTFIEALSGLGPTAALMVLGSADGGAMEGFVDASSSAAATAATAAPADATQAASQVQKAAANSYDASSDAYVASEAAAASAMGQGANQVKALTSLVQASYTGVLARVDAFVQANFAPGFRKLQRALYDFVNGVSRDTVIAPLRPGSREDAWVGALVALNVYMHVSRNVPRDDPNFAAVMAVFSLDDYERRSVDYFSYLVFGSYNVVDNLAPSYRAFIPTDIQAGVLRRVHRRMTIINGLCDNASGGLLGANDVYNAYLTKLFYSTVLPVMFALVCYWFLGRMRSRVFVCGPPPKMTASDALFDMFTPLPPDFLPSMCPAVQSSDTSPSPPQA